MPRKQDKDTLYSPVLIAFRYRCICFPASGLPQRLPHCVRRTIGPQQWPAITSVNAVYTVYLHYTLCLLQQLRCCCYNHCFPLTRTPPVMLSLVPYVLWRPLCETMVEIAIVSVIAVRDQAGITQVAQFRLFTWLVFPLCSRPLQRSAAVPDGGVEAIVVVVVAPVVTVPAAAVVRVLCLCSSASTRSCTLRVEAQPFLNLLGCKTYMCTAVFYGCVSKAVWRQSNNA